MSIRFEDPPEEPRYRQRKWEPLMVSVMKHPGRWQVVVTARDAYQAANAVRSLRSRKVRYPDGCFEFRNAGAKVYARYLGEST